MRWGRLINAALDCGLSGEDALWAVLAAAHRLEQDGRAPLLTDGELRALTALDQHQTYKRAACALGVAQSTVHRQVKVSARKLGVRMGEAPGAAARLGLLERKAA